MTIINELDDYIGVFYPPKPILFEDLAAFRNRGEYNKKYTKFIDKALKVQYCLAYLYACLLPAERDNLFGNYLLGERDIIFANVDYLSTRWEMLASGSFGYFESLKERDRELEETKQKIKLPN